MERREGKEEGERKHEMMEYYYIVYSYLNNSIPGGMHDILGERRHIHRL